MNKRQLMSCILSAVLVTGCYAAEGEPTAPANGPFPWCPSRTIGQSSDPIVALDDRYMTESMEIAKEGVSLEERERYYETWLKSWLAAIEEHADSPFLTLAVSRATALANSLGRYELSLELLDRHLELTHGPSERLTLIYEKGEVSQSAYWRTRNAAYARQSIEHFATLERLVDERYPTGDRHRMQVAIGLENSAHLTSVVLADHEQAARFYFRAFETLEKLEPQTRERGRETWIRQRESTLAGAAREFAQCGQPDRALDSLKRLARVEREHPMGLHVLAVLKAMDAGDPALIEFVRSWYLESGATDKFGAHVALAVGQRLLHSGDPDFQVQAADWFEMLLANHEAALREDPMKAGMITAALGSLADAYRVLGRTDDAAAVEVRLRTGVQQNPSGQ